MERIYGAQAVFGHMMKMEVSYAVRKSDPHARWPDRAEADACTSPDSAEHPYPASTTCCRGGATEVSSRLVVILFR